MTIKSFPFSWEIQPQGLYRSSCTVIDFLNVSLVTHSVSVDDYGLFMLYT